MYNHRVNKIYQTTLAIPVSFKGIGLHSGKPSIIKILPAEADKGIVFKRVDLKDKNLISANYLNVTSAILCTTLKNEFGAKVSTVEHLLAALYLSEIDNALIEIDNEEVPIMDGSAKNFLYILKKTQTKKLTKKRKFLKIENKVELVDGKRKISLEPGDGSLEIKFKLNYENKVIGNQENTVNFNKDNLDDVSNSRTFCLYKDIEKIKKAGLAKGGSLDNAIVVDEEKVLNKEGLRNDKEFVNHKILDLLGDFVLSGHRVLGKVNCYQGGHQLTNMFLRKLLGDEKLKEFDEIKKIHIDDSFSKKSEAKIAINA